MAAKESKSNKKAKTRQAKRVPVAYNIDVNVDPITGKFVYVLENTDIVARSIRPHNGDTVSWRVRLGGMPVAFQVEFGLFNPFGPGNGIIRSLFGRSQPVTVNLPKGYQGNLAFEYCVSIPTGWSDDPDVEPVPSDGIDPDQEVPHIISLSIVNGALTLSNPAASFSPGLVEWRWADVAIDNFTLTFLAPLPSPWPTTTGPLRRIVLSLPVPTPPGAHKYRIDTQTSNQSVEGTLTIA
jgi:hypothetical protein